jgi:hypothetical protein
MGTIILIVGIVAAHTILERLFPESLGVIEAVLDILEIFF